MQVDWKKVEKDVNKAKKHLKKKANKAAPEINTLIEEVKVSVTELAFLFPRFCKKKKDVDFVIRLLFFFHQHSFFCFHNITKKIQRIIHKTVSNMSTKNVNNPSLEVGTLLVGAQVNESYRRKKAEKNFLSY